MTWYQICLTCPVYHVIPNYLEVTYHNLNLTPPCLVLPYLWPTNVAMPCSCQIPQVSNIVSPHCINFFCVQGIWCNKKDNKIKDIDTILYKVQETCEVRPSDVNTYLITAANKRATLSDQSSALITWKRKTGIVLFHSQNGANIMKPKRMECTLWEWNLIIFYMWINLITLLASLFEAGWRQVLS